jgi:hypothetical protein
MRTLIDWHKDSVAWWQNRFGISDYGVMWLAFLEGLAIGALGLWLWIR